MLKTENVVIKFGGLTAVNNVSVEIREGEITGLIGPNGAGKTTFFNCLSGVYKPNSGQIWFNGTRIDGKLPYEINPLGLARTYQSINLFWNMTVLENVLVGMHPHIRSGFFADLFKTPAQKKEEELCREKAEEWLEFVGLKEFKNAYASSLSYGQQRLLEIIRGLASNPKLLLLDEPAAGMNSKEKTDLDALLDKIKKMGVTILMIEHDMRLVMSVCNYIYVLNDGKLLAQGKPAEIQENPEVIKAYLGGEE